MTALFIPLTSMLCRFIAGLGLAGELRGYYIGEQLLPREKGASVRLGLQVSV
jgi:hypothetical protein